MVGNGELKEMTGYPFVPEDRARVLDGGRNVEVPALRIVDRDEVEAAGIPVIDARRVHEAARAGRFERLRQLPNEELAQVGRDRDKLVGPKKCDDLIQPRLIGRQKLRLIPG